MISDLVLPFPGNTNASIEQVGGKGYSLLQLINADFPVPPGVILTSEFFAPWIELIIQMPEWRAVQDAPPEQWRELCESLKRAAMLPMDEVQRSAFEAMHVELAQVTRSQLFAVRSSSAQEDLAGASFAGGYETRLGVKPAEFIDAIRHCFVSMFDERVFAYKLARGMRLSAPSMAVVIQAQINSEVAGVAFSLNPLNNDYDQAVINANWGQGETVVAGLVTPDSWVVNKVTGELVEQSINDKKISRWLQADGQLIDRNDFQTSEACLQPTQIVHLTELLQRVETSFQCPVDIEWAIANDTIYLLQARPVTAFVPLPEKLLTHPGERRRLYIDIALSSGLTMNAPISPMGLDVFQRLASDLSRIVFGGDGHLPEGDDSLLLLEGGRMYLDVSNAMWLGGPRVMAKKLEMADAMMARTLNAVDPKVYKSKRKPQWARLSGLWRIPFVMWRVRRLVANTLLPFFAPKSMHEKISRQLDAYESELSADTDLSLSLQDYWDRYVTSRLDTLFKVSMAGVGPGVMAVQAFTHLADRITRQDTHLQNKLDRGFDGNVVVAMTIAMHRLAKRVPAEMQRDAGALEQYLNARFFPSPFLDDWKSFVREFGFRGPMEMDVAHPRYADAPLIALKQMAAMSIDDSNYDPVASSQRQVEQRRTAAATVIHRAGPIRRVILKRLHQVIDLFAGMRDTPKQHLLMTMHGLRQRLVLEGERLHQQGRIDTPDHVFDFNFDELIRADADATFDLRSIRTGRLKYYERLAKQVINFPPVIDSRGQILRAPRGVQREGEFSGVGLSSGIVSGFARTLRSPHEKPLLKGEILIAYTTDPGWTPIFSNAAAVVLEIGGALQHGAVVARELGLPCVAGIEGITTAIKDGQLIEVDGSAGTVRLIQTNPGMDNGNS